MAAKFEIPKYDGKIDFGLWQKRIKAVLVQQGLHKALLGKEKAGLKKDDEWEEQAHEPHQAAVASEDEDDADVLHVSPSLETTGSWIMDTGCSYHMCPNIEWFSIFRQCEGGRVHMGNQSECEVVGVGNIRIRMYDGVVRTLTDVRYVPGLRKSLLSLGTLEAAGYSYTGSGGYLEVRRGAQTVLRGERSGTLYRLIGTTIARGKARREVRPSLGLQDTVAYAFQAISSDPGSCVRALESRDRPQWKAREDQWRSMTSFVARECAQRKGRGEGKIFAVVEKKGRVSSQECPDTARRVIRLRSPTKELRITQEKVELHSESPSASRLAIDPVYRARTKHVGVRHQESREFAGGGGVKLRKTSTEGNIASMREISVRGVKFKSGLDLAQTDAC